MGSYGGRGRWGCFWLWDWCYRCAAVSFRSGDFDIGGRQLPEAYGERNVRAMKVQVMPGPTMELHSSSRSVPPLQQRWGLVILQVWQPLLYPVVREPCSGCGSLRWWVWQPLMGKPIWESGTVLRTTGENGSAAPLSI